MLRSAARSGRLAATKRLFATAAAPYLPPTSSSRVTLCLDLDECLIHCTVADSGDASFMEPHGAEAVRAAAQYNANHRQHNKRPAAPPDFELELPYLDEPVRCFKRPQLDDFLFEAAKLCEVVLFTSAAETYAQECVDALDPERRIFSRDLPLLTRQHCTLMDDSLYVKDLSQLGRPLEKIVCVDDHVGSCMLQPDNSIPVSPYLGDPSDSELSHVLSVLHRLKNADDVRPPLRGMYNLQGALLERVRAMRAAQG